MFDIGLDEIKNKQFWLSVVAEFQGTALFLICVTCVALSWGSHDTSANNVEIGMGIGLAIASIAQAYGHVSGGHINPAVSFGLFIAGKISVVKTILYILAQVGGGILGAAITYACTPLSVQGAFAVNSVNEKVTQWQGFGLEAVFTFLLVFTVLSITDPFKKVEPYGTTLGIGIVILVAHVCIIPFTGCGINPARSFAPSVIKGEFPDHWVFWAGPFLGALIAGIEYRLFFRADISSPFSNDEERIPLNQEDVRQAYT